MSNIEQIDFSTLTWVKTELDETLNRAKEALKTFVEDTDDTNQLQFCITYLHQIQGTLKMVELYGAAMVAEEMESVAKDLMNGTIKDEDSAYDVLMQSILQLPDYLERIELGHKDVPIVLLPLVNDLRAVRSQKLLSESALFNPNLDLGVPDRIGDNDVSLKGNQLKTALLKIRSVYQVSLLNWIKQNDTEKAINNIKLVVSKLQMILSPVYLKQLFWTYSGLLEALQEGHIEDNVSIKQIAGKVDLLIKELGNNSPQTKSTSRTITRNILYYIAISEGDSRLVSEISQYFNLAQFIPDEDEIKHAEGSLSGKNKELLQTVSDAIKDDVLVVQESLDLYIRNKTASVDQLSPILDNLHNISDTLGILGLGVARDSVKSHTAELNTMIEADQRPSDDNLLEVAKTLLKIESQLGDHIQSLGIHEELGGEEENAIPKSEKRAILQQLAKESIINLQQIKTNFVAFIESPWDKNQVKDNPRLLNDIAGALKILNLSEAGEHLESIIEYVNTDILASDSKPSAMELEQLATVISSLEYYLENLDQGQRIRDSLLSEVKTQIEHLQQHVANDSELRKSATMEEDASEAGSDNDARNESVTASDEVAESAVSETETVASEDSEEQSDSEINQVETAVEQTAVEVAERMTVIFGDDVDDEIKEVFLEEFEEELANMQEKHAIWKEDPETNVGELSEIRRIFHTLKGSGRLVGAEAIGEFGWQLENMCNRKLDNAINSLSDFRTVLAEGVEMAAGLFAALQTQDVVPNGYNLLLQNAENVTNGDELEVAPEVVEAVVEESESDESTDADAVIMEETGEDTIEAVDDDTVGDDSVGAASDESELGEIEFELEDIDLDDDVELDEIALDDVESVNSEEESVHEAENTDDDDFVFEFDLDSEDSISEDESDEVIAENTLLDTEGEITEEDSIDLELSESDEFDLEQELAELDLDDDSAVFGSDDEMSDDEENETELTHELEEDLDTSELASELDDELDDELDLELDEVDSEVTDMALDESVEDDSEDSEESISDQLDVDPVFIEILQKEVGGHLNEMNVFVSAAMEQEEPKISDDFIRVVHTLNGAASMASVKGITQMTTPLEKMSIMMLDRNQPLSSEDVKSIEQVIHHAKTQMNLLGTGETPVDESIGDYFRNRIQELYTTEAAGESLEDVDEDLALEDLLSEDLENEEVETIDESNLNEAAEDSEADEVESEPTSDEMAAENEVTEADDDEPVDESEAEEVEDVSDETEPVADIEESAKAEDKSYNLFDDEGKVDETEDEELNATYESEVDDELLEIFSEEASEIFDRADHLLAELEEKPDSPNIIQALQRDLHTLKGGARMAGLNQIGDLSHQLESLFESIAEKNLEVNPEQHELMSQVMHKLHGMVNADDFGQLSSIETETAQLEQILSSEGGEIKEKSKLDEEFFDPLARVETPIDESQVDDVEALVPKKKANVLSGGQIKVNSELLDKLVNFAGEVSIYRSRMEQQSAELKLNIDELENTVERVRRQLRELEHETEAQIISNYQAEGDELEEDFDPLELDQFSTIQQLSRSLSESVSDLTNIQSYLQESARSSETLLIQQSRVNTELQEGLMETRLVTFNSLIPRLRRVLRTAGQELDKNAKLVVKGAEGEMDKTVLEGIQAPLEHMIRNAMVHGLEADRKAAGKPDQGHVVIELSREATEVVITVKDDGAGINTDILRKKAIERGIIGKDTELTDGEIAQLITHSGLSAADEVTKLAGRGVGMDVVNNEIKRLGGSIEIISETGAGTTFVIRLPYTLALTQAIIVQVADHRYAIPASGVEGLIRMSIDEFRRRILENDLSYDYAGEEYNIQELNKLLSVDSEALVEGNQVPLVMIKSGDQGVALRVDQTFGGREIVVKSVGTQVASVPGIFGATILGDGAVVLILDIIPMHRAYMQKLEKLEMEGVQVVEEVEDDRVTTIMVVDDSITMRRAGERMLARNDFEVMTAKDGLDALNKLQEQKPDLMLLDIEMPRMDGFELATAMKQSERFADIPIIMITSRTGQKHKDRAKEIGVERYLGKPYQELELLDNINDLLQLEDA
ncbi:Hpt domain-containing protein [Marinicella litoralis]|uniref:Chemotaxis protein CheA n=1 Tax=Marinicella litoralis TaxID=644220 RepID=A0A4R6XQ89_9GAMM|nr:Hpt domain-containing protein [Marinicella litoralis]TDR19523.1 chemosensory pili system protein ChpA (sensor histidine kinase/response regulator) [Marinicella litoralis]